MDPLTRGDPTSPLRWTCKSRAKLAAALTEQGWRVSSTTVGRLLHRLGYRLQSPRKRQEGATHPDRNAQFEHINRTADEHLTAGQPVISVDTKKKELVGNFKNGGQEWQPKGTPTAVLVHDFPTDAEGKAIPYGVYDMARNEAWVSVGWDHDTPAFAVASIRHWWQQMGCGAYPDATTLFITADAGGSNGYRLHAWKHELQQLADDTGLTIEVSHFPPGTSKWNKIEHRLFCHITANWRGTPLTTYETIVDRIGNVRTATGLRVRAELDAGEYPTGVTVPKEQMDALALVRDAFHGEWKLQAATPMKLITLYRSLSLRQLRAGILYAIRDGSTGAAAASLQRNHRGAEFHQVRRLDRGRPRHRRCVGPSGCRLSRCRVGRGQRLAQLKQMRAPDRCHTGRQGCGRPREAP